MPPCGHKPCREAAVLAQYGPPEWSPVRWQEEGPRPVPANDLVETEHHLRCSDLPPESLALDQREVSRAREAEPGRDTFSAGRGVPGSKSFPRRLSIHTESKPRRGNQECTRLPCVVGWEQVAEVLWKTMGVRGQCPFPGSSLTGITFPSISASPGSEGQQALVVRTDMVYTLQASFSHPSHPHLNSSTHSVGGCSSPEPGNEETRQGAPLPVPWVPSAGWPPRKPSRTQATVLASLSGSRTGR